MPDLIRHLQSAAMVAYAYGRGGIFGLVKSGCNGFGFCCV